MRFVDLSVSSLLSGLRKKESKPMALKQNQRLRHVGFIVVIASLVPLASSAQGSKSDISRLSNADKKTAVEKKIELIKGSLKFAKERLDKARRKDIIQLLRE